METLANHKTDKEWIKKVENLAKEVTKYLDNYQFNLAAERLYEFVWHEFADKYIEDVKGRIDKNSFLVLSSLFIVQLKLLHPFMPFVTEEIYQTFQGRDKSIMIEPWPSQS
jgi:valyl-tRNA synthetase